MNTLIFGIIGKIAVLVGVQSKAKEIVLTALKSGKIRKYVSETDNKIDDAFLDFLVNVIDGQWDTIWNNVLSPSTKGAGKAKGTRNKDAANLQTADAFSAALQKAVKKAQKKS